MKYSTYVKAKDYSMTNIVPVFRSVQEKYKINKDNVYYKYAKQLAECGTSKIINVCNECKTPYFNGAYTCKNRFCPVCQKQKSLILFSKVYPKIIDYINKGYYVNIMTFTIKDTVNLNDGLNLLKKAYRNLSHSNKTYRFIYSNMFIAGIKSLEVKRGENSKMWHPHFHAIVVKNKYSRDRELLNLLWNKQLRKLVNDADHTIYEDKYYTNEKLGDVWIKNINKDNKKSKVKAVYECIKYITKYDCNLENDLETLVSSLKGKRSVESWGEFRGIEKYAEEQKETLSDIKNQICLNCGNTEFTILDGITLNELEKSGISTDLKDFDLEVNYYDDGEI